MCVAFRTFYFWNPFASDDDLPLNLSPLSIIFMRCQVNTKLDDSSQNLIKNFRIYYQKLMLLILINLLFLYNFAFVFYASDV